MAPSKSKAETCPSSVRLETVAEFHAGPNRNPVMAEGYLLLSHLAPHGAGGGDFLEAGRRAASPSTVPPEAALQAGDLVVSLRGAEFRVAVVPEQAAGLGVGTGMLRLRLRRDGSHGWRPRLLRWYLMHRVFREHRHQWIDYRGLMMIRIGDLRSLSLPCLSTSAGAALEDLLEATARADQACQEELLARRTLTDAFLGTRLS